MSASTAGADGADRRAAHSPSAGGRRRTSPAVFGAVAAVALAAGVHAVCSVLAGAPPSPLTVLLAAGSATAVLAAARACGLGAGASALAALLTAASPVAVAACASPGTAAAALLLVPALAAVAHRLLPRPATAPVVLALGPLAAPALGGGLGGWGAGSAAWLPSTTAALAVGDLDPVLPLVAVCAAAALLAVGRTVGRRWLGGAVVVAGAVVVLLGLPAAALAPAVVPGCLAVTAAAAALVAAATRRATAQPPSPAEHRHTATSSRRGSRHRHRRGRTAAVAVAAAGVLLLLPTWSRGVVRASASGDPAAAAARWLSEEQSAGGGVAVDPALYDAVVSRSGLESRVVPAGAATGTGGDDPAARWLVAGPRMRAEAAPGSWAAQALAASHPVAAFGEGDQRVEVREVDAPGPSSSTGIRSGSGSGTTPGSGASVTTPTLPSPTVVSPTVTSAPPPDTATPASQESMEQLLQNSRLDFSRQAREAVQTHPVDLRLAALLVQLGSTQPLSVSDLPIPDGGAEPLRTVVVDGLAGKAVGADPEALQVLARQISAQDPAYRAVVTQEQDGTTTVLRLMLPPAVTS